MSNERVWVKNFSIERIGYHLYFPAIARSIPDGQKVLFGDPLSHFSEYFGTMEKYTNAGSYFVERELRKIVDDTIKLIYSDPKKIKKIHSETYEFSDEYFEFSNKCINTDFSKLSNKEILKIYKKLIDLQTESHSHALITTWFVDSENETLSKLLIEKIKELVKRSGQDINLADAFSLLTTLPKNSFVLDEELESLKLVKKIRSDKKAEEMIGNLENFSKIPEKLPDSIKNLIKKHFGKWRWFCFDYMGPAYNIDYFLMIWKDLIKKDVDLYLKIKELVKRPSTIKKQRDGLIKKLKLSKSEKNFFDMAADIIFLKGYRKDAIFHGSYALSFILEELAKRFSMSIADIQLISPPEMVDILNGKKLDIKKIRERNKFAVVHYKCGKTNILVGKSAANFLADKNFRKEEAQADVNELKGTPACSGYAKGRVKIVNNIDQVPKVEQGDVMVAHTTFPSLVPAMKKASAIITEDGGITCHAAIVSREMGKPCIVGVKQATKLLKDGDLLEVDANKGIIKKINK